MSLLTRALEQFTTWALSKNEPGPYRGGDDPRWAYTIETDGDKYLTKVRLLWTPWFEVFLHDFHRADIDRHLHNHPFKRALSILLSGSYDEIRGTLTGGDHVRRVRWWNWFSAEDYHKVQRLHGEVWTLFVSGPHVRGWGFRVGKQHVHWKEYLRRAREVVQGGT